MSNQFLMYKIRTHWNSWNRKFPISNFFPYDEIRVKHITLSWEFMGKECSCHPLVKKPC